MKKEILNLIEGEVEKVVNEITRDKARELEAEYEDEMRGGDSSKQQMQQKKLENFRKIRKNQIKKLGLIGDGWGKEYTPQGQLSMVKDVLYNPFLVPDDIKEGPVDTSDIDDQLDNIDEVDYEYDESYRSHIDDLKKIKKARGELAKLVAYSERTLKLAKKYQDIFLPGGEMYEMYTTPSKIYKLKPEQVGRIWNELSFHIKDSSSPDDVHKVAEINRDFANALTDGIKEQRENEKLSMGGGEVVEESKLSPNAMAKISNNVFETLFLQLQNSRIQKGKDFLAGWNLKYNTEEIMDIDDDMGSLSINESLYNSTYVEGILGIKLDKDKSGKYVLTEGLKREIEQESLLYEGMVDSIKNAAGEALAKGLSTVTNYKDFTVGLGKIILNVNLIPPFLKKTVDLIITPSRRLVLQALEKIKNLPALSGISQFIKEKLQQMNRELSTILASGGAKAVFIITSLGAILAFVADKIKELTLGKASEKGIAFIKQALDGMTSSITKTVASKMTDISTYLGWLGPIVGGINFVVQTFGPVFKQVLTTAPVVENLQAPIFLLEEMTKGEIKDLVKDEIKKNLKKMVEDELEKMLKDNKGVKNQIGDLSKEILKMLYKDLSIHHTYVIDRVKF